MLRRGATARQSAAALQQCQASLERALETVNRLHAAHVLEQEDAEYLSAVFRQLGAQTQDLAQGHAEEAPTRVVRCCVS